MSCPRSVTPSRRAQALGAGSVTREPNEWQKNPNDPAGPLNHILRVFLIDPAGNIRNIYSSGTLDVRLVLADIGTLVAEQPN